MIDYKLGYMSVYKLIYNGWLQTRLHTHFTYGRNKFTFIQMIMD